MAKKVILLEPSVCETECQAVKQLLLTDPDTRVVNADSEEGKHLMNCVGMGDVCLLKPKLIVVSDVDEAEGDDEGGE